MKLEITGAESGSNLIHQLVFIRLHARHVIRMREHQQAVLTETEALSKKAQHGSQRLAIEDATAGMRENLLQMRFREIEIGRYLRPLCEALDRTASREAILDALTTNRAHRNTAQVRLYGNKCYHFISILDLENSATGDYGAQARPLKWCHTMAFVNALQTSSKLDRIVHDGANDFFNGAFGEFRERPLIERLTGQTA